MNDEKTTQENMDLGTTTGGVDSVEKYQFAPIKGYPMLNWQGKRPFTSTQYYPAQLKEVHGEEVDGWRNKIFWGDNLQAMSHLLKEFRGKVDLIYIDPPFDSKADYKKRIQLRGKQVYNDSTTFEEKQYTDIWSNDEYLQFVYERVAILRELLSESGSLYFHCDWHKSHHIRCILDEVFGVTNFRNEIVWKRTDAKGDAGQGSRHYARVQDAILYYTKGENYTWNTLYTPLSKEYVKGFYKHVDAEGRTYKLENMLGPGGAAKGNPVYEVLGVTRAWRFSKEKMENMIAEGLVIQTNPGTVPMQKKYLDNSKGVQVSTWWDDISMIRGFSAEKVDYPTQKPETLLERILSASSNPGDLVFDCFMGSGTTQAVAMKLGRRFLGADINLGAVQTTAKRLIKVSQSLHDELPDPQLPTYTGFEVHNVNNYDIFRNPAQAKELLLEALEIQKLEMSTIFDGEKDGRMVKIMPVNRIATRADLNELTSGFDYKAWERRKGENPNRPVEKITLVCMGHEPDLKGTLEFEAKPYKIDVEVVDILRDKSDLEFKRDSDAKVVVKDGELVVERFYPMNLLQKLSMQKEAVDDWRELIESILIDWNYDGAVLQPAVVDIPEKKTDLVIGRYKVPADAGSGPRQDHRPSLGMLGRERDQWLGAPRRPAPRSTSPFSTSSGSSIARTVAPSAPTTRN